MELLKYNTIVNDSYKPNTSIGCIEYFNRAMVFAQTNYQKELDRVARTQFSTISPSRFFEEYAWVITCAAEDPYKAGEIFPEVSKAISPYCHSFWDLQNFPKEEVTKERIVTIIGNEKKFASLHQCADIINRGIKLFGWEKYRNNFLDCPERLVVLPGLNITKAKGLSRNIGLNIDIISFARLHTLVKRWGFKDTLEMCQEIQRKIPMPLKIIELILWYAVSTFETTDIVSVD